jgi:hypothetical protein
MGTADKPVDSGSAARHGTSEHRGSVFFKEKQIELDPRNWYVSIAIAILLLGSAAYAFLMINNGTADRWLALENILFVAIPLLLSLFLPWWFYRRLLVRVSDRSIEVSMRLWTAREIALKEVARWEVRVYHTRPGFARWKLTRRLRAGLTAVYAINGILGVQVELRDGRKMLIGTQHPERLSEAIRKAVAHLRRD